MTKSNKNKKYKLEEDTKSFEEQLTITNKKLVEHSSTLPPELTNILKDFLKLINKLYKK